MKKKLLLSLLFTVSNTYFLPAYCLDSTIETQVIDLPSHLSSDIRKWPRVKTKFHREKFLNDYNEEHGRYLGRVEFNNLNDSVLNESCYKALANLKNYYKQNGDKENYGFTYLNIAKLLLTHQTYPLCLNHDQQKKDFHQKLRDIIGRRIILNSNKSHKLQKWSYIYEGMLFLDYVKRYPQTQRRNRHLADAYHEFCQAMGVKTTKTSYLLAAEVILDFDYIPGNLTTEESQNLAYNYIDKALEKEERRTSTTLQNPVDKATMVERNARPTYINELTSASAMSLEEENKAPASYPETPDSFLPLRPEEAVFILPPPLHLVFPQTDELTRLNLSQIRILEKSLTGNLAVRRKFMNPVWEEDEHYEIDGHIFRRQNVSGCDALLF